MKATILVSLFFLALALHNPIFSQVDVSLKSKLTGKESFHEIISIVDEHYDNGKRKQGVPSLQEPKYKHWKRWEWYLSGRLGQDGEIVNISQNLNKAYTKRRRQSQQSGARNTNSNWSFIGPSVSNTPEGSGALFRGLGRIDRIAFHPTNPSILYVGTPAGGLWKSINAGNSWMPMTDQIPSLGISGIVVDHNNPNIIYILTGDGDSHTTGLVQLGYARYSIGVLKSIDGGVTWLTTGTFPLTGNSFAGFELVQDPNDSQTLFAATDKGVYRTKNGGDTWTRVLNISARDVQFKPQSSNTIYSTGIAGFYYSTNGGNTWQSNSTFSHPLCANGRIQLGTTAADTNVVYLLSGPAMAGSFCGVFKSSDSGLSFSRQTNSPNILGAEPDGSDAEDQSNYDLCLAISPSNNNLLFTGGLNVWKSTDGGSTLQTNTVYHEDHDGNYIHPDVHDLEYNSLNGHLYAATDGGVYLSVNNGISWQVITNGIATTQFYHATGFADNGSLILGGTQDNGVKFRQFSSESFDHIHGADGFDVAFFPDDGTGGYFSVNNIIAKFTENGVDLEYLTLPGPADQFFFKTLVTHNSRKDTLFVGAQNVYRSFDGGESWTNQGGRGNWTLEACPSFNPRYYSAGNSPGIPNSGNIYRSDDNGSSWISVMDTLTFPTTFSKITDIGVRPNNSSHVWAVFGGFTANQKIYTSIDAGETWTNLSGSLPNIPINCITIGTDNGAYIGTDLGVYYRSEEMNDWILFSNHLPNTPVTELIISNIQQKIRAATFGRGMWESSLAKNCVDVVDVSGQLEGEQIYQSASLLTSTAVVAGGEFTNVQFQSEQRAIFLPGFEVRDGSNFQIKISACIQ